MVGTYLSNCRKKSKRLILEDDEDIDIGMDIDIDIDSNVDKFEITRLLKNFQ